MTTNSNKTNLRFQYDIDKYLHVTIVDNQVWFKANEIVEYAGLTAKNTCTFIRRFSDMMKKQLPIVTMARPDGVMTWHISKEGVTNLIERARVRGHKQADSLERWLINEVYPELPKEVQPKPIVPTVVQPANETTPETTTGCILRVDVNDQQEQVVSGRLLHQFLEVDTKYTQWFNRMSEYGFSENQDFIVVVEKSLSQKWEGDRGQNFTQTNHILKLDMAKEICMLQRTDKGKQARQYFIQLEKDWNSPDKIMARALKLAELEIGNLKVLTATQAEEIAVLKPKAETYDKIMSTESTYTISDVAFLNGLASSKLFKLLREEGWLHKPGNSKHLPAPGAPEGTFREIKGIYGAQIRVTVAGKERITRLIKKRGVVR